MRIVNFKELERIDFYYPEFMAEDAETKLKNVFVEIQFTRDLLAEANKVSDDLRSKLKELEKQWAIAQLLGTPIFKTTEKPEIKNEVNLGFNFSADINKGIH